MIRNSLFLKILALAALAVFCASPASAERLQQRVARGNNVGMGVVDTWCMPWITASWTGNTIQYPKGSGNFLVNDAWTIVMGTARDLNNDGLPEDTLINGSGGRDNMPGYCSIEGYDIITAAGAVEPNMEGYMGDIQFNRVWTTKDDAELAEWPVEARNPRTSSGTPVVYGAETMFTHSGDVFNSWGGPEMGFYCGWSLYFLDFAESNNMVYVHNYFQNVTEYMKYNPDAGYRAVGQANPNGWTWHGMWLVHNQRQFGWLRQNMGWAYHPAKDIDIAWCKQDPVHGLSPPNPPLLAVKVINYPKLRDQEAKMLNIYTVSGTEFGVSGFGNLVAMGLSHRDVYKAVVKTKLPAAVVGQINPFSGREVDGWPGVGQPTDQRYNQWWWGGASNWNHYNFYGELIDVAPRDSFGMDFVIMFPKPGHQPLVAPTFDLANIDSPYMQEAFAPAEAWTEVAKTTVDGGFVTPSTPVAPPLTIIPGDREVTIAWSDVNLQTPDAYYVFLQDHPELDPNGVYRQYDFEGFKLYRSFVGPNDSHSEQIYSSSISGGDLSFAYVDKLNDDNPYFRMRNGMKVWYALVPYDMNYDTNTGESFSLPDPASGKAWNRA
ncbi:MAG TPA: hypothetical protein VJ417_09055, partial [Candidatus Glassbacteria bacterium]|nr:hypothetical protein [Candidatus Glassbacteria bacterium]